MNTHPRSLACIVASALASLSVATFAAAPKVEESIIGPANEGGVYVISAAGAHAAYVGMKGTRFYVNVDGVSGPEFDEIYKSSGQGFYFIEKVGIHPARQNGAINGDSPVLFSLDGKHHAYMGRQGEDYVVIHDGKEIGRGKRTNLVTTTNGLLSITPAGKQVYWFEQRLVQNQGQTAVCLMLSGKAGPFAMGMAPSLPVFSPDEQHHAYHIGRSAENGKQVFIVDGKDAGYYGQEPVYSADSLTLYTIGHEQGRAGVLANGKVICPLEVNKLVVAPAGRRWAAFGNVPVKRGNSTLYVPLLIVDGKEVAGSENVQQIWFSPDGKRYAASCLDLTSHTATLVLDGDTYSFKRVDPQAYWTADSSKVIFTVATDEGEFIAVNDDLYPRAGAGTIDFTVPRQGGTFAWNENHHASRTYTVVVNEKQVLPDGIYPMSEIVFSPDGSRFAFVVGAVGRSDPNGMLIDGQVQPGVGPGFLLKWYTQVATAMVPFVFSDDSKHVAYFGRAQGSSMNALFIDGKPVFPTHQSVIAPRFTPDGQHVFWVGSAPMPNVGIVSTLYVDGQPTVQSPQGFFYNTAGTLDLDEKGSAIFLAADGDTVKRYRVTATSDTSIASLLEKGTAVAAVPTAPKPPPATASTTPVPTPTPPAVTQPAAPLPAGAAPAAPAVALTWNDLVRRPETRPVACTVNKEYKFQNGGIVRAGTKVNILDANGTGLVLGTPDGRIRFGAKPEETDVLAVANAAWAQLTPAQRDFTVAALPRRTDLWPYTVNLTSVVQLQGQTLKAGEPLRFLGFDADGPLVFHVPSSTLFNAELDQIDLFSQARAAVANEAGLPGRLMEEFAAAKLVNPVTGQAVAVDLNARPKYVVLYRGAGWCGPCQAFSPGLVKLLKEKAPKPEDVALIYVSADNNPAEAKAYTTKIGIDWPTIFYTTNTQLPAFYSLFGDTIPQLVVTDRHGKVLIDSNRVGTARALQQLTGLL